eukprot:3938956-Prorocentrum_lima.AAC.1
MAHYAGQKGHAPILAERAGEASPATHLAVSPAGARMRWTRPRSPQISQRRPDSVEAGTPH